MRTEGAMAGCQGKSVFESYTLANEVFKRARRDKPARKRQVYKCHYCKKWHIGTTKGKGKGA